MHIGTCQSVLGVLMHKHVAWSHCVHQCSVKVFTILTNVQKENINKVISGYMPFSPQAPHTLPVGFLTPWLCWMYQLSNMQCVVVCWWWSYTLDRLRSTACPVFKTHALPRQMFGYPHSSVHGAVHCHTAWGFYQSGWCTRWTLHTKGMDGVYNSYAFFDWDWILWASSWRRVCSGRNTTLTPRGVRTRLIASDSTIMLGSVRLVFGLSTFTSSLLLLVMVCFWMKPEG